MVEVSCSPSRCFWKRMCIGVDRLVRSSHLILKNFPRVGSPFVSLLQMFFFSFPIF